MTLVDERAPTRAPGVELLGELRDSGYAESRSMARRADGQIVQLTPMLYELLDLVDGSKHLEELAAGLCERTGRNCCAEDVTTLLDKLEPMGLLCKPDGSAPEHKKPMPLLALRWKVAVSDPEVTRRITAPFAVLFRRFIAVPVLFLFAAVTWWLLFRHGLASGTRQAFDSPGLLLSAFLLVAVSAGWHEFGHAAACRAAGAQPGAMGAGIYIVWPAFYTNVDDARRLDRWGRLEVDLGGLHFNAVAAVAFGGLWALTRVDALLLVVGAQLLLMVRQLAPVVRADGYHILSDLVGVPDLFQHVKPTLAGLLPTNWGKPQPLRRGPRWIVRVWVLVVIPLLFWMMLGAVLVFPRVVATAVAGFGRQGGALSGSFARGDVVGALGALLQLLALTLPVFAISFMVIRLVRRTVTRGWKVTAGRPLARAAFLGAMAVVLALLVALWWPSGQYRRVRADERGTVPQLFARSASSTRPSASSTTTSDRTEQPRQLDTARWSAEPIANVTPSVGYALVPRDERSPAVLLVEGPDGELRSVITDGPSRGYAFPFELPDAPRPGDNQALAVNDRSGSVVYDVAAVLVWVDDDGSDVTNRNEAYALASCAHCKTVAVAFQVLAIVGDHDVIAPENLAVAANGGCLSCDTAALAVQLVVTLREMPSEELQSQIEAAMAKLDDLELSTDPYTEVKAVEREIVTLLESNGLLEDSTSITNDDSSASTSTSTTAVSSSSGDDPPATTSSTVRSSTTTTTSRSTTTTTSDPEPTTTTSP